MCKKSVILLIYHHHELLNLIGRIFLVFLKEMQRNLVCRCIMSDDALIYSLTYS
jgi:hypothetical protein